MRSSTTILMVTDLQRSVLHMLNAQGHKPRSYTPYGHYPVDNGLSSLSGFNGEQRDPVTGHYLLGNGYRAFNPVLMRFNSPDSLSPFGEGGLNAYAYCVGDPVNQTDPTGHTWAWVKSIARTLRIMDRTTRIPSSDPEARLALQTFHRDNRAATMAEMREHNLPIPVVTLLSHEQAVGEVQRLAGQAPPPTYDSITRLDAKSLPTYDEAMSAGQMTQTIRQAR